MSDLGVASSFLRYTLTPHCGFRVSSRTTAEVTVSEKTHVIPLYCLRWLLHFTEPCTIAEAYALAVGAVELEDFAKIIFDLAAKGLLQPESPDFLPGLTLFDFLNESYRQKQSWDAISAQLAAGRCVVIRDAFEQRFAEKIFSCLDEIETWRPNEQYSDDFFHSHHHNLSDEDFFPPELAECRRLFSSAATKEFLSQRSGRDCTGETVFTASRYFPGDYSLPHNDLFGNRNVAFIWHLTKRWKPRWGGALYWCPSFSTLPPSFNTLVLFNISPCGVHFVTQVNPTAQEKRLAITGWWQAASRETTAIAELPEKSPAQLAEAGLPQGVTLL